MRMKEYSYNKTLSDYKLLEEDYECIRRKEESVFPKGINKSVLMKSKIIKAKK